MARHRGRADDLAEDLGRLVAGHEVEEQLALDRIGAARDQPAAFRDIGRDPPIDDLDGAPGGLQLIAGGVEGEADRDFAIAGERRTARAAVRVLVDVLVQILDECPAEGIDEGGEDRHAGAGLQRRGERDLLLVDRLDQVFPGHRHWQAFLLEARLVHHHAHRCREVADVEAVRIIELRGNLRSLGRVGLEDASLLQLFEGDVVDQVDHVGQRLRLLGDGALGARPGRAADEFHVDAGMGLLEGLDQRRADAVGRIVDHQLSGIGGAGREPEGGCEGKYDRPEGHSGAHGSSPSESSVHRG